jgi:UDP-glucose 4-epimerase
MAGGCRDDRGGSEIQTMTDANAGMPTRAVVTGAAGFIGSHLAARLAESGREVIGIDNERSGDWSRVTFPCTRVERDLVDMTVDDLVGVMDGADVCFHLAAEKYNSSSSTPQRVIDVNISATQRLVDAAARAGVRKVVFTSSLYAYGSMGPDPMSETDVPAPTTAYGMSKIAGEHLLRVAQRDSDLSWSVARLFFVYGTRQYAEGGYKSVIMSNFERIRRGERPTIFGDGEQSLDYVYVDDVVEALVRMTDATYDGGMFNIGTGRGISVNEMTKLMLEVSGTNLEPIECPADWTAGSARVGDPNHTRKALGWSASIDIDAGLRRVWEWMGASRG